MWESLGRVWVSEFVLCVREFGVSLWNDCVQCVGDIGAGLVKECVLCLGEIGAGLWE